LEKLLFFFQVCRAMGPGAAALSRHGRRRGRFGFEIFFKKNFPTAFVWKNNFFFLLFPLAAHQRIGFAKLTFFF
jgi:hypothetical protein